MTLGGILEFFLGNTFSFVVFCSFGGFFNFIMILMRVIADNTRWFLVHAWKYPNTKFQRVQHLRGCWDAKSRLLCRIWFVFQ